MSLMSHAIVYGFVPYVINYALKFFLLVGYGLLYFNEYLNYSDLFSWIWYLLGFFGINAIFRPIESFLKNIELKARSNKLN